VPGPVLGMGKRSASLLDVCSERGPRLEHDRKPDRPIAINVRDPLFCRPFPQTAGKLMHFCLLMTMVLSSWRLRSIVPIN
jgi:hypothetical protein